VSKDRFVHPVPGTEQLVELCETCGWRVRQIATNLTLLTCTCERRHVVALGHVVGKSGVQAVTFLHKLERAPCLRSHKVGEVVMDDPPDTEPTATRFAVDLRGSLPHEIDADVYTSYAADVAKALQERGFRDVLIGGAAVDRCLEICVTVEAPELEQAIELARDEVGIVLAELGCELVGRIDWLYAQQLTATAYEAHRHNEVAETA